MAEKARENYLRVTEILYPFSGLADVNPAVVAKAAERGTKVHKICEGIASGLGEFGIDEETQGYVDSFKHWWGNGLDVVAMEQRFWDDDLQITGQVDFIINEQELMISDLKTPLKESKTWPIQGAAYAYLARQYGYDIQKITFVKLRKDGKPAKLFHYPLNDALFLSVYHTYKHFYHKESA